MIRVCIVDDHRLIRRGLQLLLEAYPDIQVVGEAEDGDEAIQLMHQLEVDVMLMDVSMPNGIDGFTASEVILQNHKHVHIVLLTMHDEEVYIQKAIQLDIGGYILKNSKGNELHEAIHAVHRGEKYYKVGLPEDQIAKLFKHSKKDYSILSVREKEIVRLTVLGYTNKQMSQRLFISPKTVENHKANIMHKLELKCKSELIQYGLTNHYHTI
ncbi:MULTISPECIES: response regulator transcription factor [Virgibacillus]|uniref:DNA-binding response regulator, NarL/FixJ family, contains REC and HTH domains n=1 Tax=Virgibacillus chiguensis TaxID=411959 RepID=A0A1M5QH20_9BACI|nr:MULTISPECIES: response regulator transcription factor [Virgibacillus]SHH13407.1 DNA-binding response regulator, NarL/FixJ family, contains REC and HTH domains [Virgibacillus chiguensis]